MDAQSRGLQCGWAGCPEQFDGEAEWIRHVSIHVFTLKPDESTPWLGPPELDPDRQHVPAGGDDQSDGEDYDDDYRTFSHTNALSSPSSTPPQQELPNSPDLAEKINGPSVLTTVEPLRLLGSPPEPERALSHRTSGSADDVEAALMPVSPPPSSQNTNSTQGEPQYLRLLSQPTPVQARPSFPPANVNRFRRGTFQINSPAESPLRFGFGLETPQSQSQPIPSQTLPSQDNSQVGALGSQTQTNGSGTSWLNTQAFRPPESQDLYESD